MNLNDRIRRAALGPDHVEPKRRPTVDEQAALDRLCDEWGHLWRRVEHCQNPSCPSKQDIPQEIRTLARKARFLE